MAGDKSKSLIMAQRLKDLRNERGLSHESLRKALMEKYEIDISVDSLKNYEVSKVPHAKAYKNDGMRVEYLRCLADFYGVSSDYLLGISDTKTPNTETRAIVALTGLSELNVCRLSMAGLYGRSASSATYYYRHPEELARIKERLLNICNFGSTCGTDLYIADCCVQYINFLDDIIAAASQNDRIVDIYRDIVNASESESKCTQPLDIETSMSVMENGMVSLPNSEFIRFASAEIAKEIDGYITKKYLRTYENRKDET